jgi:hypothetical protein
VTSPVTAIRAVSHTTAARNSPGMATVAASIQL